MKIKEVICAAGRSGYMHRDLLAIKSGKASMMALQVEAF